jgi:hypothetical protein
MEIWSPRTTKKIVWFVGIICLIVVTSEFFLRYWLNPWERQTAAEILKSAVVVRYADSEDLRKQFDSTETLKKSADRRAWTMPDYVVGSSSFGAVQMAFICRRYELGLGMDPKSPASIKLGQFGCSEYERLTQYSNLAIRTRLGF